MGPLAASHRFEPHRGELRVSLRAPSIAALFEEAGRALAAAISGTEGRPVDAPRGEPWRVTLSATDREALLVDWLNELIFLSETRRQIFDDLRVESLHGGDLRAEVRGRADTRGRSLVKAATFHGLSIQEADGEVRATVLLDI